jgi:hypothetical protein
MALSLWFKLSTFSMTVRSCIVSCCTSRSRAFRPSPPPRPGAACVVGDGPEVPSLFRDGR